MSGHRVNRILWVGTKPAESYTKLPNELARDHELSWAARGLAAFLWTHREGFELSANGIATESGTGDDTIRRWLAELDAARWLAIEKISGTNFRRYHAHPARKLTEAEHSELITPKMHPPKNPLTGNSGKGAHKPGQGCMENRASQIGKTAGNYRENPGTKKLEDHREEHREHYGAQSDSERSAPAAQRERENDGRLTAGSVCPSGLGAQELCPTCGTPGVFHEPNDRQAVAGVYDEECPF